MPEGQKWEKLDKHLFAYHHNDNKYLIQTYPFRIINVPDNLSEKELKGIAQELPPYDGFVTPGKYYLPLFIGTTSCNFQCKYCYAYRGSYGQEDLMLNEETINSTINFLEKKMESLASEGNKKEIEFALVFFGGESLLNFSGLQFLTKKMREVTADLNKKGKTVFKPLVIINTNGSLFKGKVLEFLKRNKDILELVVSFDGLHHDKYRVFAENKPTSRVVIEGIKRIKRLGFHFAIGCCEPPEEIENVDENIKYITGLFGKDTEINLAFIRGAIPQVKTKALYPGVLEAQYSIESLRIFGEKVAQLIKDGYIIYARRFFNRIKEGGYLWRCPAALYEFCVYPGGNVYPCHNFLNDEFKLGNILDKDFDPTANKEVINKFKSRTIDDLTCKDCVFQTVCLSSFDCPSHSHYDLNDFYKVDERTCTSAKIIMSALMDKFIEQMESLSGKHKNR